MTAASSSSRASATRASARRATRAAGLFCGLFLGLLMQTTAAVAENRALLIGVSDYTGTISEKFKDLLGPPNDVTQVWRYLLRSGFAQKQEQISVLANRLPAGKEYPQGARDPTYARIVAELDRLAAAKYQQGDWVLIYYSGHGTTIGDMHPELEIEPEPTGEDQVLMPADMGRFDEASESYPNSLVDDELGRKLDAIRRQGANVWAIFDACFSGTATRGNETARGVSPEALGRKSRPPQTQRGLDRKGFLTIDSLASGGKLVAFYAVDEAHLAYEWPMDFAEYQLPVVQIDNEKPRMGVFTNALLRSLAANTPGNFAQLFQDTLADIAADPRFSGKPRPIADGDLLTPMPGKSDRRWPGPLAFLEGDRATISAGTLQGFEVGAEVSFHEVSDVDKPLAMAVVDQATPVNSTAHQIKWLAQAPRPQARSLAARVARPVVSTRFYINRPAYGLLVSMTDRGKAEAAFDELQHARWLERDAIKVRDPDALAPNLIASVEGGSLWLRAPSLSANAIGSPLGVEISLDLPADLISSRLGEAILRYARAERLFRFAASNMIKSEEDEADIIYQVGRYRESELAHEPTQPCPSRVGDDGGFAQLSEAERRQLKVQEGNVLAVGNCDVLRLDLANFSSNVQYFVSAFYLDAEGAISVLHPVGKAGEGTAVNSSNCAFALPPSDKPQVAFEIQVGTWDATKNRPLPVGLEKIVFLAIERDAQRTVPDFCAVVEARYDPDTRAIQAYSELQDLAYLLAGRHGIARRTRSTSAKLGFETFYVELDLRP